MITACQCQHKRTITGNICGDCKKPLPLRMSDRALPKDRFIVEKPPIQIGGKDYDTPCTVCGEKPTMHPTGLCGPCATGEAETYGGNW